MRASGSQLSIPQRRFTTFDEPEYARHRADETKIQVLCRFSPPSSAETIFARNKGLWGFLCARVGPKTAVLRTACLGSEYAPGVFWFRCGSLWGPKNLQRVSRATFRRAWEGGKWQYLRLFSASTGRFERNRRCVDSPKPPTQGKPAGNTPFSQQRSWTRKTNRCITEEPRSASGAGPKRPVSPRMGRFGARAVAQ